MTRFFFATDCTDDTDGFKALLPRMARIYTNDAYKISKSSRTHNMNSPFVQIRAIRGKTIRVIRAIRGKKKSCHS